MTNGPDDLGNGSATADDPLTGPLTGPLGGPAPLASGALGGGPLGSGFLGTDSLGALRTPGRREPFIGRDSLTGADSLLGRDPLTGEIEPDLTRRGGGHNGSMPPLDPQGLPALTAMPAMDDLTEPVFEPPSWSDSPSEPLADHPLLRGLLEELPPKGSSMPTAEWLNRWFEAVRSILELLYSANKSR